VRLTRLLPTLAIGHGDGSYLKTLAQLAKTEVLVIDEWALAPLTDESRRDLLEIFDDRHGTRSTIITGQLPVKHWGYPLKPGQIAISMGYARPVGGLSEAWEVPPSG
jgi:DNA replication protein DnaC